MNGDPEDRLTLRSCDATRDRFQEFYLLYSTNVFTVEDKFQIKTNLYGRADLCVSTQHHPSRGEFFSFYEVITCLIDGIKVKN